MAEVTSVPPIPFVTRLRSICQHIDKNVALLKLDLSRPSGSTPFTYDRGLNAIKSDISELKQKCEELKPAMESIKNFSNWLHSMQDLVNQQTEDVKKMEEYLVRFGYNPIPNPATEIPITSAPKVEVVGKMSTSGNRTAERALQDSSNSKTKPVAGSQSNKQSEVPLVLATAPKQVKDIHVTDTTEYQKTPVSSRNKVDYYLKQSAGRGSCYRHGHSTVVEEWLKGIENCRLELTPDVLRHKRAPVKEKQEQRDRIKGIPEKTELPDIHAKPEISEESVCLIKVPGTPAQNYLSIANTDSYCNTPVEPELSEYTTQFLNLKRFQTGKENAAPQDPSNTCSSEIENLEGSLDSKANCNQGKSALLYEDNKSYSNYNMNNSTPEEPIVSYQALATVASHIETKTPEEPVLSAVALDISQSNQMELGILKDPVLSYHLAKCSATSELDANTPEEPVLSFQDIKPSITTDVDGKTPEEPILSKQIITDKYVDPVLSHASSVCASSNVQSHVMYDDDMPESPQLSEYTLSLLSVTNQGYLKSKSMKSEENFKQDSWKIHRNDAHLFGRGGRDISHRAQPSQLFDKASKEKISLPVDASQDKKKWHHPGIPFEKFVGGGDDDIPPSPQLSETTQRLFAPLY